jgi:hypothetical protein
MNKNMSLVNKFLLLGFILLLLAGGFLVLKQGEMAEEMGNYAYFAIVIALGIKLVEVARTGL